MKNHEESQETGRKIRAVNQLIAFYENAPHTEKEKTHLGRQAYDDGF